MAKVIFAPGFKSIHGSVSRLLYRVFLGRNIVYGKPDRVRQPNTPAQRNWRQTFREATAYAKCIKEEAPATWSAYVAEARKRCTTATALATQDWLKPPKVTAIDLKGYQRQAGDVIAVQAVKDFEVTAVRVSITNGLGAPLESGAAVFDAASGWWKYTVATDATGESGLTVRATAWDHPGHTGWLELTA